MRQVGRYRRLRPRLKVDSRQTLWLSIQWFSVGTPLISLTRGLSGGVRRVNSTWSINTRQKLRTSAACVAFPLPCLTLDEAAEFEKKSIGKLSIADHLLRCTLSRYMKYR